MPVAIGTAITSALLAAGATAAVATIAGAVGTFLVNAAISIGLGYLAGQLARRSTPLPTPSDGQSEIKQPLSPRVRSYGTVRVGGVLFWFSADGRWLYKGLAINHGLISSIVTYHIDENQVDVDSGTDEVTTEPYGSQNVFIEHRLGLTPEASYASLEAISGLDNLRGDGVATILGRFENPTASATFQNTYPSGQPELRVTIDSSVVYDPRDASQSRADASTWGFSDNPVVCLMDYLTHVDGYGIAWEKIERNLDQWIEAMDVCDELVDLLAGGFTRKYRVAGSYRLTDAPRDVVAKFESTCDGRVWVRRDGSIGVTVGKFPTELAALVHIGDGHVTGYEQLTRGQDPLRSVAGIRAEYMSPQHDYREYEAEPWPTAVEVLALSEDRVAALDLLWVPGNSQARRLMKRAYMRATATWHGTVHLDAAVLRLIDERYFRLTITELGIADQVFEITRFDFDPGGPRGSVDVISVDAAIDDWDPSEEGTLEADALEFIGNFEKTAATAIDLLVEAGAQVGEYCLIACQNATGFPAAPTGYAEVSGADLTSGGLHMKVYGHLVDGSEVSTTLQSGAGSILVQRFRGLSGGVTIGHLSKRMEATNSFSVDIVAPLPTPFVLWAFGAANATTANNNWLRTWEMDGKTDIEDHSFNTGAAVNAAYVEFAVFREGEEPPDAGFNIGELDDIGSVQGIIAFTVSPA